MQRPIKDEVKYLENKLDENADSILFARLADAYLQMDRIDEALELCEKSVKKHPLYVTGHYVLGKCYLKKKMFDQAEKELKRVLLFDPKYIAAHRDYGDLMAQIGWHNTCEMSYEEIVRIDPFNEMAKRRLEELNSQSASTREQHPGEDNDLELKDVEEDILHEMTPVSEEKPGETIDDNVSEDFENGFGDLDEIELEKEPAETPAKPKTNQNDFEEKSDTPPDKSEAPPVVKELFKETEDVFEDDNANLDLLEDIFRDDELPDLKMGDEDVDQAEKEPPKDYKSASGPADQSHLYGEEFNPENDVDKAFDGLEDDEIFALMSGDEQFNKPSMKSPLDIPEPPRRKEQEPEDDFQKDDFPGEPDEETEPPFDSSMEDTVEQIKRETKPQFQPPEEEIPPEIPEQDDYFQASEEPEMSDFENSRKTKEKIVTSTLGEIYAAQHQYAKAIGVYEILRKKDPDNELYSQKIEYLQKKLEESQME